MEFVCDAPGGTTWFRILTEAEAVRESQEMRHAVDKYFRREWKKAQESFKPASTIYIEQAIGLEAHVKRAMPLFLTLRDEDGTALVTAMLPPGGRAERSFGIVIVGADNADPYPSHGKAIKAVGDHFGLALDRALCYPYRR